MRIRRIFSLTLAMTLAVTALTTGPVQAAAPDAPAQLEASVEGDGSVHFQWAAAPGASSYRLEVSPDTEFSTGAVTTIETSALDHLTRWPLSPDEDATLYWRLKSVAGTGSGAQIGEPTTANAINLSAASAPEPLGPGTVGGVQTITYPDPTVFQWQPVLGAVAYQLEYTSDTLGGGANVTTQTVSGTSFSPVNPLARIDNNGNTLTWKWRVRAQFYDGNANLSTAPFGVWSDERQFEVTWDVAPTNLHPANETTTIHSDLYFSWDAVPGAAKYEIALSSSEPVGGELVNPTRIQVFTTTYIPTAQVSDYNRYFQVTPLDYQGNRGTASPVHEYKKKWGTQPGPTQATDPGDAAPVSITGSTNPGTPEQVYLTDFELEWEPLPRATFYFVELYGPGYTLYCRTPNTSATIVAYFRTGSDNTGGNQVLKGAGDCLWSSANPVKAGDSFQWRVQGIDITGSSTYNYQSNAGSPGSFPAGYLQSSWSQTRYVSVIEDDRPVVETQSVALDLGSFSIDNSASTIGAPAPLMKWERSGNFVVLDVDSDPVWEQAPGYEIIVYKNAQRTAEIGRFRTPSNRLRINGVFQDNTTSNPYYAAVRPIVPYPSWTSTSITLIGGIDNSSVDSFVWQKSSHALTGLTTQTLTDGSVRLTWTPQSVTGLNDGGSRGYQIRIFNGEALQGIAKKIEFPFFMAQRPANSNDGEFPSTIADIPLPPGNNYSYEVAPLDANGDPGRVSRSSVFSVGIQVPVVSAGAAVTGGSAALQWDTVPGALKYSVQFRRTGTSSWTTIQNLSQTSTSISGLDQGSYEWQVRAHDASNQTLNVSAWSPAQQFTIGSGSVSLATANNQVLPTDDRVLRWTSNVNGAVRFQVQLADDAAFTPQGVKNFETTASAFAPSDALVAGKQYHWRVRALSEPVGNAKALKVLSTSNARSFTVRTVPSVVRNLKLVREAGGILATWTALTGADAGTTDPVNYRIEYRVQGQAVDSDDWSSATAITTTAGATSWQIGNLAQGVTYQVRIAAVNSEGQGPWSATVTLATASAPVAAPTLTLTAKLGAIDVRVGAVSTQGNGGSAILGYRLKYKRTSDVVEREIVLTANQRTYTISGLVNNTSYDVSVAAYNAVGVGPAAGASTSTLGTSSAPRNLRSKVGDRTATITWAIPAEPGGDVTGYVIEYREGTSGSWKGAGSASKSATSYTKSGLTNGKTYQFRVAARTKIGVGAYSTPVTVKPAGKPTAPTKVTAKSNKKGKITVKWNKAKANGAKLNRYIVQFSANNKKWKKVKNFKPNKRKVATKKGKRGKTVYFRVIARNSVGKSAPSRAASVLRR